MQKIIFLFLTLVVLVNNSFSQNSSEISTNQKNQIYVTHSVNEAVFRSIVIPGWGQFYNNQSTKGYLLLGTQAVLLGGYFYLGSQYNNQYNDYTLETNPTKTAELFDTAESTKQIQNYVGYAILGTWLFGVVDACFSGWNYKEKLDLSFYYYREQPTLSVKISL